MTTVHHRIRRKARYYDLRDNTDDADPSDDLPDAMPFRRNTRSQTAARKLAPKLISQDDVPLLRLPNELLFKIGEQLEPEFIPDAWTDLGKDVVNFSMACRRLRFATSGLRGRNMAIVIDWRQSSLQSATARIKELTRLKADQQKIRKLVIKDDFYPGSEYVPHNNHRMFWNRALAEALGKMPRLRFFCYARDIDNATSTSPYKVTEVFKSVFEKLATITTLEVLMLCGVRLDNPGKLPNFAGPMKYLQLLAVDDSALALVKKCRKLESLRVWRDFMVEHGSMNAWFDLEQWAFLQELQLKGFVGMRVPLLKDSVGESREKAREIYPTLPLKCLDLDEPWHPRELLAIIPRFCDPPLTVFKAAFWKDGWFRPSLVTDLAGHLPHLEELHMLLETHTMRWWPYKMNVWAAAFSEFKSLRLLRWNATPFPSHPIAVCHPIMTTTAQSIANAVPTLEWIEYTDIEEKIKIERDDNGTARLVWQGPFFRDTEVVVKEEEDVDMAFGEGESFIPDDTMDFEGQAAKPAPPPKRSTLEMMVQAREIEMSRGEAGVRMPIAGPSGESSSRPAFGRSPAVLSGRASTRSTSGNGAPTEVTLGEGGGTAYRPQTCLSAAPPVEDTPFW